MSDWVPLTLDRIAALHTGSILEEANEAVFEAAKALQNEDVSDVAKVTITVALKRRGDGGAVEVTANVKKSLPQPRGRMVLAVVNHQGNVVTQSAQQVDAFRGVKKESTT